MVLEVAGTQPQLPYWLNFTLSDPTALFKASGPMYLLQHSYKDTGTKLLPVWLRKGTFTLVGGKYLKLGRLLRLSVIYTAVGRKAVGQNRGKMLGYVDIDTTET